MLEPWQGFNLELDEGLDCLQPLDIFLVNRKRSTVIEKKRVDNVRTCCSLYSAYSGMNIARLSLIPRSCKYFSNSSWTDTSRVSNCVKQYQSS